MGAGLRGGYRVLIAPPRGPVGRGEQPGFSFHFCIMHMRGLGYPFCLFCVGMDWCGNLDGGRMRCHDGAWFLLDRVFLACMEPSVAWYDTFDL